MKNSHVPLPDETYIISEPHQVRKAGYDAIVAFAVEAAGTSVDLDDGLEAAAIEHLAEAGKASK